MSAGPTPGAYTVDAGEIDRHGGDVAAISQQIEEAMAVMRRKLESLQGTWKGQAAVQYADLHREWETAQERVRTALDDISRALKSAGATYSQTEQDVKASFMPRG
ncbi:WXG100 family type VII secretion target [Leekyejoonella antrihumi]|uniref:ESAT-6-like protein n=1 Tax=Leekyejoonella antrihumi TaxID=1660198 RepID=A0A563DZP3_9MICO|nr:WXG100 family type VII secretion target [Leekyejoonella antrihumi]TWP35461.1 WXG100 family type VII secretion target [Leekyejoonella antrihumi]